MASFCTAVYSDLIPLFRFPLHSHVLAVLYTISLVCLLKYSLSCFSSYFCFLDFIISIFLFVLAFLLLLFLFLVTVINLSLPFFS